MVDRSLILLRGLPGSGKSTLAALLSENGKYPVHSIDTYFTDSRTGEYSFRFQDNHLAYKQCEKDTRDSLEKGIEKIFVDNTFTLEWELEPYLKMAADNHYRIFVFTVENYHGSNNVHDIPESQLVKMASGFNVKLM
ncbi:MAG: AAA family ATPase [Bacteroidetes bacterium]|nr:AAA family ATPase [Bacteroidota bacterium]